MATVPERVAQFAIVFATPETLGSTGLTKQKRSGCAAWTESAFGRQNFSHHVWFRKHLTIMLRRSIITVHCNIISI